MKKTVSIAMALALAAGSLTACGGSQAPATEAPASSAAETTTASQETSEAASGAEKEKTEITIMFRDSGEGEKGPAYLWLSKAAETYQSDQYDISVKLAPIAASTGDYYSKIALNLSSPDACPDIILEDSFQVAADVEAGYLTKLDPYLENFEEWNNGFIAEAMKAGGQASDGSYYTVPICTDTRLLFYNKEIFKAAGLPEAWQPENWDEILEAARTIRDNTGDDVVPFWFSSGAAEGEATSMNSYEMLLSGGKDFLMEDGKYIVESQSIKDSLEFFRTIYTEKLGAPLSVILNGSAARTGCTEYMPSGKLGIILDGCWVPQYYYPDSDSAWEGYEEKLGVALMPLKDGGGYTTMSGGWGIAIPENSSKKEAAFDFLKHAVTDPALEIYLVKNGNLSVFSDNSHFTGEGLEVAYKDTPFMKEIEESVQYARFRPQDENYPTVSSYIYAMVESVVTGTSPEDAMAKFKADVIGAIGEDKTVSK